MSVESVVDAAAAVVKETGAFAAVYASTGSGEQSGIEPIQYDIPLPPAALVRHLEFELVPGTFERIRHQIQIELFVGASNPGAAEAQLLPLITTIIAAFRPNVGLKDKATIATIARGGPPDDVAINAKPFITYPIFLNVLETGVQNYSLTP